MPASDQIPFTFLGHELIPELARLTGPHISLRIRGRRQRAVLAFRSLGRDLAGFVDLIDSGQPLIKGIANQLHVAPSTIKAIKEANPDEIEDLQMSLREIAQCVDQVPPDCRPMPGQWHDFSRAYSTIYRISRETQIPAVELFVRANGNWGLIAKHPCSSREDRWFSGPARRFWLDILLPEIFLELKRMGYETTEEEDNRLHNGMEELLTEQVSEALYGEKGAIAIMDAIRDWYAGFGHPLSLPGGPSVRSLLDGMPDWCALTPSYVSSNRIYVHPIERASDLIDEGLELQHCIGRYALLCCYSNYYAVSLQSSGGFKLSTALIHKSHSGRCRIIDHRGPKNDNPDRRAISALAEYVDGINHHSVAIDNDFLNSERRRRALMANGDDRHTRRLYPFYFDAYRSWHFRAYYCPMLPRSQRDMSLAEWLTTTGLARETKNLAQKIAEKSLIQES